mgnify:CR=1 FL=1
MQIDKPFSRGGVYLKEDVDLMIDCFLANFRINPHNNDTLKVRELLILDKLWYTHKHVSWVQQTKHSVESFRLGDKYFAKEFGENLSEKRENQRKPLVVIDAAVSELSCHSHSLLDTSAHFIKK